MCNAMHLRILSHLNSHRWHRRTAFVESKFPFSRVSIAYLHISTTIFEFGFLQTWMKLFSMQNILLWMKVLAVHTITLRLRRKKKFSPTFMKKHIFPFRTPSNRVLRTFLTFLSIATISSTFERELFNINVNTLARRDAAHVALINSIESTVEGVDFK